MAKEKCQSLNSALDATAWRWVIIHAHLAGQASRDHLASRAEEDCISEQLLFLDESKMGKISWQTAFPRFQYWCDLCSVLLPSSLQMYMSRILGLFLDCCVTGSALSPTAGTWENQRKRKQGSWRHQRAGQTPAVPEPVKGPQGVGG